MVTRVTNNNNKVLPVRQKEKETLYVKLKLSALQIDQGRMPLLWAKEVTWNMGELVVYKPGIEACVLGWLIGRPLVNSVTACQQF